ncbi:hypothetical protein ACWEDZ_04175 [Streptomyces sp. NPDC005047]
MTTCLLTRSIGSSPNCPLTQASTSDREVVGALHRLGQPEVWFGGSALFDTVNTSPLRWRVFTAADGASLNEALAEM